MSFSERLRQKIDEFGLNPSDIARELYPEKENYRQTVRNWIKGRNEPKYYELILLCDLLKCTPNDLLLGEGSSSTLIVAMEDGAKYGISDIEQLRKENEELKDEVKRLNGKLEQANEIVDKALGRK